MVILPYRHFLDTSSQLLMIHLPVSPHYPCLVYHNSVLEFSVDALSSQLTVLNPILHNLVTLYVRWALTLTAPQ